MLLAAAWHVEGVLHEGIDCVVDSLDAVGVVYGKLGVVGGLDLLIDDTIDYAKCVHLDLNTSFRAVLDLLVLLVEVVVESWAIMTSITMQSLSCVHRILFQVSHLSVHRLKVKLVISGSSFGLRSKKACRMCHAPMAAASVVFVVSGSTSE